MKKPIRFDERKDLIAYVESNILEEEHIGRTIYKRAKYNYFIKNLTDKKNYNDIINFVIENSDLELTDLELYELVQQIIKSVKKSSLKLVEHIYITQSELDFISALNDIKLEKIAFVVLCLAKYHNEVSEEPDNCIYFKLNEIKNMARINMNKVDFEYFYNNLYDAGVLKENSSPTSTIQIVDFISADPDDTVVIELQEVDYLELAYVYLDWKNKGDGYGRCEFCGRLMKQSKKKSKRFCEDCSSKIGDIADDMKVVSCVDCGKLVHVSKLNTESCRCENCNLIYQRLRNARKNKAYRKRNKDNS